MTRPFSNLDLELLENLTALALDGNDLCKHLAVRLDSREQLELLSTVQLKFNRIKETIITHRKRAERSHSQPQVTRKASSYDPQIIPQTTQPRNNRS